MTSFDEMARNLASQTTELRKKRGLTQAALARLAGIPRSTLTNLESGMGNPSLANLARVAAALQVSFEELLAAPRSQTKLIRKEDVKSLKKGKGQVTVFKLLPDPIPGMEMDRMEFEPGARLGGVPHSAGTKEYFHCVQGQLTVVVSGESFDLKAGDVLAFPGDSAHNYVNHGPGRAVGVSVVTLTPKF